MFVCSLISALQCSVVHIPLGDCKKAGLVLNHSLDPQHDPRRVLNGPGRLGSGLREICHEIFYFGSVFLPNLHLRLNQSLYVLEACDNDIRGYKKQHN